MKIVKVMVVDEENVEQELTVLDGTVLLLCEDNKILTQITTNAAVNMELVKKILDGKTV